MTDDQRAQIMDKVIAIVAEQMNYAKEKITLETSFMNDLGADSLDTVELLMEMEDEFKVQIPEGEAEKIQTVGDAVDYISRHSEANSDSA